MKTTRENITQEVLKLMGQSDPKQISMRDIAHAVQVQPSVIYHHFDNKDEVLKAAFLSAQTQIRSALIALKPVSEPSDMLRQRIKYQLMNAHLIVPMLRYFMAFKLDKPDEPGSFIPPQAYMHIKQAILFGIDRGVYASKDPEADARVIVHAINGFVLEYYPRLPKNPRKLISVIQNFVERALSPKGVPMK